MGLESRTSGGVTCRRWSHRGWSHLPGVVSPIRGGFTYGGGITYQGWKSTTRGGVGYQGQNHLPGAESPTRGRITYREWSHLPGAESPTGSGVTYQGQNHLPGVESPTGGGDFWRTFNRWMTFASCFTHSTSWMTSRLAAPARPTFTVTGFTRALRAKFWIFFGIVAENSSVWRWAWGQRWVVYDSLSSGRTLRVTYFKSKLFNHRHH